MNCRQLIIVAWLSGAAGASVAAERMSPAVEPLVARAPREGGGVAFTFDPADLRGDTRTLPIGVFDSGIGGLTVLEAILALDAFDNRSLQPVPDGIPDFAGERFVYLGDQANMPYGNYPREGNEAFLRELILKDAVFLLGRRFWPSQDAAAPRLDKPPVKAIVVACNTATAYGLTDIRAAIDRWDVPVPVVGVVEAGARGVLESDRAGRDEESVAVLATIGTCSSQAYPKAIAAAFGRAGSRAPRVVQRGSADLAAAIEGDPDVAARTTIAQAITADLAALVDDERRNAAALPIGTVVLGCTHFPLVQGEIVGELKRLRETETDGERLIAETIAVVDPATLAAKELFRTLATERLRAPAATAQASADAAAAEPGGAPHLFFISVPRPIDGKAALSDKFRRTPGRLEVEDTRAVPMDERALSPGGLTLVRTRLPHVWRALTASEATCRSGTGAAALPGHRRVAGYAATVHPLATQAALDVFARGGNAIDAAAAAGLTLGVVDGHNSGIGGGCFVLIRLADRRIICVDGRETAPAAASRDMFLRDGAVAPSLSRTGPLAVAVPGAVAAYAAVVERFGRLPLSAACEAGVRHASDGFAIDAVYARKLARTAEELSRFPSARAVFLRSDGSPWPEGHVLVQEDLARTYRAIAAEGSDWFYRGPFAVRTAALMREQGGVLVEADFHDYRVVDRTPLETRYRSWTIVGFPPPSSGGVHVAQMLNILDTFPAPGPAPGTPAFAHRLIETMKIAFADRAHWLGDPRFVDVPLGLAAPDYARELAGRIDAKRATPVPRHGDPPDWQSNHFEKHTTHFATADTEGNWVSITATINTAFGSKMVVPGTGVLLNNEMDDFAVAPGAPNHFGLVGGEANCVAPGKRPLSSMSPTLVLDAAGEPVMSVGGAGGPTIITQVLLGLVHCLDHGLSPAEAVAQPRFHHQWSPDRVRLETAAEPGLAGPLRDLGHDVQVEKEFGACQIIQRGGGEAFEGASDPRVPGLAAGSAP